MRNILSVCAHAFLILILAQAVALFGQGDEGGGRALLEQVLFQPKPLKVVMEVQCDMKMEQKSISERTFLTYYFDPVQQASWRIDRMLVHPSGRGAIINTTIVKDGKRLAWDCPVKSYDEANAKNGFFGPDHTKEVANVTFGGPEYAIIDPQFIPRWLGIKPSGYSASEFFAKVPDATITIRQEDRSLEISSASFLARYDLSSGALKSAEVRSSPNASPWEIVKTKGGIKFLPDLAFAVPEELLVETSAATQVSTTAVKVNRKQTRLLSPEEFSNALNISLPDGTFLFHNGTKTSSKVVAPSGSMSSWQALEILTDPAKTQDVLENMVREVKK